MLLVIDFENGLLNLCELQIACELSWLSLLQYITIIITITRLANLY